MSTLVTISRDILFWALDCRDQAAAREAVNWPDVIAQLQTLHVGVTTLENDLANVSGSELPEVE